MVALGVSIPVDPALAESLDKPFPWAGHQRRKKSRWLIDHLAEPEVFERWLDWAMNRTDRAEDSNSP